MVGHITLLERLEVFAEGGVLNGFTLRLWDKQAERLKKEGILLKNPQPTGRKGENRYEIDFSSPIHGTLSMRLYLMALEAQASEGPADETLAKQVSNLIKQKAEANCVSLQGKED